MSTKHQPPTTNYKTGLVIGRFQPFHLGHKFLIEEALKVCDKIIIGIGSSNITDGRNPYSYRKRKQILSEFVKHEKMQNRVLKIIPIVDHPDDDVWLKILHKKIKNVDVVIGDNEWVNGIFEKAGTAVIRIGFLDRERLEGKLIRKLMDENKKWEDRTLSYILPLLEK